MYEAGFPLSEALFTLIVSAAVLALLTDTYADAVAAATILAVIWQVVNLVGASLFLATVLIVFFAGIRLVAYLVRAGVGGEVVERQSLATFLDELLRSRDGGGQDHRERRFRRHNPEQLDTDVETIEDYRR